MHSALLVLRWTVHAFTHTQVAGSAPAFTSTATLVSPSDPSGIHVGTAVTVLATYALLPGTGPLASGIADFEVYAVTPSGQDSKVNQQYTQTSFSPSQSVQSFAYTWTPSSAGTFAVMLGVFDGQWATDFHWNGSALTLNVT